MNIVFAANLRVDHRNPVDHVCSHAP
jgi:hypothetical protein